MINPLESLEDSLKQVGYLVTLLSATYDFQYDKDVDLENLGNAIDALIFVNNKLDEQRKLQVAVEQRRLAQLTSAKEK